MSMQKHRRPGAGTEIKSLTHQAGVTLIETMIALALSLVVTSAMVVLMANSLGTATRGIHMSQLTDELRNAMSMMTRDVRRANYSANSIFCYGYSKCGFAGGNALQAGDVTIVGAGGPKTCLTFSLDRGFDGNAANDSGAGFRRNDNGADTPGWIEMYTGDGLANCGNDDDWIQLTDPDTVNITQFVVVDDGSIEKEVAESRTSTFTSRQREIQIRIAGRLVLEKDKNEEISIFRQVVDTIYVRNDYILEPAI